MPRNCTVFFNCREETWSTILQSQNFDSIKWPTVLVCDIKGKTCSLSYTCVDQYILLLKYLPKHMHFITNGFKSFLKINSSDPRQCVPLREKTFQVSSFFFCRILSVGLWEASCQQPYWINFHSLYVFLHIPTFSRAMDLPGKSAATQCSQKMHCV